MSALSSMAMDGVKRVPGGACGKVVETGEGRYGTRWVASRAAKTTIGTRTIAKAQLHGFRLAAALVRLLGEFGYQRRSIGQRHRPLKVSNRLPSEAPPTKS